MIVYICPKCGGDLQLSVKATYQNERKTPSFSYGECQPPINVTECFSCGWREEKRMR